MEEKTFINKTTRNSISMRSNIPQSIVTNFDLDVRDQFGWEIKSEKSNLITNVKPIKKRQ